MVAYASAAAGAWGTGTNWNPVGVPGAGDTVTITHAMTDNATRSIGGGVGNAIQILAGSLTHIAPGAAVTFTINGNVLIVAGFWAAGTSGVAYGGASDSLSIQWAGNWGVNLASNSYLAFYGNPAWNEASDLDRTTTSSSLTGGVTTSFTLTDDLGLRAGGGDVLVLASDSNGWLSTDLVTTSAYNSGTKTVTLTAAPTNNHASGTRIMNMSRNIEFRSSTTTRRGFIQSSNAGTPPQSVFDHCSFRYLGNASTQVAGIYVTSAAAYFSFIDCAFFQNRQAMNLIAFNRYTGHDYRTFTIERCNFGLNDNMMLKLDNYEDLYFSDCWCIGEHVMREEGEFQRSEWHDCVFDSIYAISWPTGARGRNVHTFRDCTFNRIDTTNKAFDTASQTQGANYQLLMENCEEDASTATLIKSQALLIESAYLNILHRDQTDGENEIQKGNGTIYVDTSVHYASEGGSLKFDPSSATWPLKHTFGAPVAAGQQVKVKVYARKDSSYGSSNRPTLKVRGAGIAEVTDTMSDVDDTWELLECLVTPAMTGMLECELWTQAAAGLAWFDGFHVERQ